LISKSAILVSWLVLCLHLKKTTQLLNENYLLSFSLSKVSSIFMGNHFTLYTDHKLLPCNHTQPVANFMMIQWLDTILDYDFKIIHRPGIQNVLPDMLSRLFETERTLVGDKNQHRT
jgi:hypothetical protein